MEDKLNSTGGADTRPVAHRMDRYHDADGRWLEKKGTRATIAPAVCRKGIRTSLFIGCLAGLALFMGALTLSGTVAIHRLSRSNEEIRAQVQRLQSSCDSLQSQVDAAKNEINVAYTAKEYGLVSAGSLPVILLQAPDEKEVPVQPGTAVSEQADGSMALILGN